MSGFAMKVQRRSFLIVLKNSITKAQMLRANLKANCARLYNNVMTKISNAKSELKLEYGGGAIDENTYQVQLAKVNQYEAKEIAKAGVQDAEFTAADQLDELQGSQISQELDSLNSAISQAAKEDFKYCGAKVTP